MNSEQFSQLCESCDHLLRDSDSINRISIQWLHVLRGHPQLVLEYEDIFQKNTLMRSINVFFRFVVKLLHGLLFSVKSVSLSKLSYFTSKPLKKKIDVFIFSHLLNEEQLTQNDDFYFGSIPQILTNYGKSSAIILLNQTNSSPYHLIKGIPENVSIPRILISSKVGLSVVIAIYTSMIVEALRLVLIYFEQKSNLDRRVTLRASVEAISAGTFFNLCLFHQVKQLLDEFEPSEVFFTFEGHAYERIIIAASKSTKHLIRSIGYQHAAVFETQHAMKRCLNKNYNPDKIYTTGHEPAKLLSRSSINKCTDIQIVGTHKAQKFTKIKNKENNIFSCLVVPEAFLEECYLLFSYSLFCAVNLSNIKFVWRIHPHTNKQQLLNKYSEFREIPDNIEWSKSNLNEDIEHSQAVLYRGSTVAINATARGLVPIYLSLGNNELLIDPLYLCNNGKEIVMSNEFPHIFKNPKCFEKLDLSIIQSYSKKYYEPLRYELFH